MLSLLSAKAKAINDRGDVVGFADSKDSKGPIHAILWRGGKAAGAIDLGVLPGYVASEAYGVNDHRVVFGLLYDKKESAVPFRWANGDMAVLRGPNGALLHTDNPGLGGRNAINSSGEMTWTVIVRGDRRAVRWTPNGKATYLPALPGHAWTDAFGINDDGIVSGWSRKLPNADGAENPVLWTRSGKVIPLKTSPGQADGIAEATQRCRLDGGLSREPEQDGARDGSVRGVAAASGRATAHGPVARKPDRRVRRRQRPRAGGRHDGHDEPQDRLPPSQGRDLADGLARLFGRSPFRRCLVAPTPSSLPALNDINEQGAIVGNVFGLAGQDLFGPAPHRSGRGTCSFGS